MSENFSPEVILSSRVRLARNIIDYPFAPVLNDVCRKEIIEKTSSILLKNGFSAFENLEIPVQAHALSEEHRISREFAKSKETRALFIHPSKDIYVMVCEEDHLRIQAFESGLSLLKAGEKALETDQLLQKDIRFAFDKEYGYLTHCPTNLGTAMRASVMMFLPALTMANRMGEVKSQLEKIGVTIRGLYGEGSAAEAYMYQISNSLSLGLSENDLLHKIDTVARRIADDELQTRDAVFRANTDALTDKIFRSMGILKYATMISGKEFLDCFAYIRLGISLGLIKEIAIAELDTLLHKAMPAHILVRNPDAANNTVLRDKLRAQIIQETIGGKN